jgi:hypothetical protein
LESFPSCSSSSPRGTGGSIRRRGRWGQRKRRGKVEDFFDQNLVGNVTIVLSQNHPRGPFVVVVVVARLGLVLTLFLALLG